MMNARESLGAQLGRHFLFQHWGESQLRHLARFARVRQYRRGEMLFQETDPCAHLLILRAGQVQVFRNTLDGREIALNTIGPGGLVGCAALFVGRAYPASARVVSPKAEVIAIEGDPFLRLLEEEPALARRMIAALAERLTAVASRLESLGSETSPQRVAKWLLEQPSRGQADGRRTVRIEGSKKAVAEGLGMTPETFSRCLRQFSDRGWIEVTGKEIAILNAENLAEFADG